MLHVWLHRIDVKLMVGNGTRPGTDIEQRNGCRIIWQVTKDWSLGGYSTDVDQLPSRFKKKYAHVIKKQTNRYKRNKNYEWGMFCCQVRFSGGYSWIECHIIACIYIYTYIYIYTISVCVRVHIHTYTHHDSLLQHYDYPLRISTLCYRCISYLTVRFPYRDAIHTHTYICMCIYIYIHIYAYIYIYTDTMKFLCIRESMPV